MGAPAASLWAPRDSDMEEFDSKDISSSKDEDCVPLGERLLPEANGGLPRPAPRLRHARPIVRWPGGRVLERLGVLFRLHAPRGPLGPACVLGDVSRSCFSGPGFGRLPIRSARTLPRSLTAVWHRVPLAILNSSERQSYPQTFRPQGIAS